MILVLQVLRHRGPFAPPGRRECPRRSRRRIKQREWNPRRHVGGGRHLAAGGPVFVSDGALHAREDSGDKPRCEFRAVLPVSQRVVRKGRRGGQIRGVLPGSAAHHLHLLRVDGAPSAPLHQEHATALQSSTTGPRQEEGRSTIAIITESRIQVSGNRHKLLLFLFSK